MISLHSICRALSLSYRETMADAVAREQRRKAKADEHHDLLVSLAKAQPAKKPRIAYVDPPEPPPPPKRVYHLSRAADVNAFNDLTGAERSEAMREHRVRMN